MSSNPTQNFPELEVFFDSACPLCAREINMARTLGGAERVLFTDIASPMFSPVELGVSQEALEGTIHGRVRSGEGWSWVYGVDVFRELYSRLSWKGVSFSGLVWASRLPGVAGALALGYRGFARIRIPLGNLLGRPQCEGTCKVGA